MTHDPCPTTYTVYCKGTSVRDSRQDEALPDPRPVVGPDPVRLSRAGDAQLRGEQGPHGPQRHPPHRPAEGPCAVGQPDAAEYTHACPGGNVSLANHPILN